MAEYIEREEAVCIALGAAALGNTAFADRFKIAARLRAIPAADVRHVVMCRDCKHKGWVQEPEHGKSVDYCRLIERCVDKQFFCAAGERKQTAGL